MILSLKKQDLKDYLRSQLNVFFPDKVDFIGNDVDAAFNIALDRMEYCCKHVRYQHFCINEQVNFKHTYSDQYCMFLYFVSKSLWEYSQNKILCDKLVLLNRLLHSILLTYTVNLPDIFLLIHSLGTVIGNAEYSDYLVILQNVTINTGNVKIGKGAFLSAGCSIVGDCTIGDRTSIGVNTTVFNRNINDDTVFYTDSDGVIKEKQRKKNCRAQDFFITF